MTILVNSFSGGRTSAYMTKRLMDENPGRLIINVFANTGQEHEKTLEFVRDCDTNFGFNTIWIEAIVNHTNGIGNKARIVSFETASRNGEPFEAMIQKHGIPNMAFSHCSRELKRVPILSYLRSLGLKNRDFEIALGIRVDEAHRAKPTMPNVIYPLVEMGVDKQDVLSFWEDQVFDLELLEHQGNCKWCWKKSDKKHFMNLRENPEWYDFPDRMEQLYPHVGPHKDKSVPRTFFRGNRSVIMMKRAYELAMGNLLPISNADSGCSESCEAF